MKPITRLTVLGVRVGVVAVAMYWLMIAVGTHIPAEFDFTAGHSDKWRHLAAFGGLTTGLLYITSSPRSRRATSRRFLAVGLLVATYAVVDEWTQRFIPGRTPDLMDVVADLAGMALAMVGYLAVRVALRHWQRNLRHSDLPNAVFAAIGSPRHAVSPAATDYSA